MKKRLSTTRSEIRLAHSLWGPLSKPSANTLTHLVRKYSLCVSLGDLVLLDTRWYVTHSGLLRLARRKKCDGIHVQMVPEFCDPRSSQWMCRAIVYKSPTCKGFVGHGDANPGNVAPLIRGSELRMAETRSVDRALRAAYAVPLCSVEEIGSFAGQPATCPGSKKLPQPANGNGNHGGRSVRDRLHQLIRQHQLDASLVKSYATDFCGVKILRDATREQVESFVAHLADWAEKDRNALLCQLNSYLGQKEGAA
jgi:hypothetical protein